MSRESLGRFSRRWLPSEIDTCVPSSSQCQRLPRDEVMMPTFCRMAVSLAGQLWGGGSYFLHGVVDSELHVVPNPATLYVPA